ncbi:DUF6069 family protein [Micromonospora sp. DT47]|uniref:DUF6069 family protein n=1 Tax=Micromonospora sp. DT47 TaxID=3393431 RepID=UPI003CEC2E5D
MSATTHPATTRFPRRRALGVGVAVLACVLIWVVGKAAGVDFTVTSPGRPTATVGLGPVVVFSLGASLLGWLTLVVLERFTPRAGLIWTALAVVVTLLSFVPLFTSEATGGTKVTLGAMHLAVAVALVALLPSRTR